MSAKDRFTDNPFGQVFSPSSFASLPQQVALREKLDAMPTGKFKDKAEAAWTTEDYAVAAFWEDTSRQPPFAQPDL